MRTGQAWLNCLNPTLKEKVLNYKKFDKNSLKEKHESFSQFLLESIAGWPGETYDVFIGWPKWVNSIYEEAVKIETQKK